MPYGQDARVGISFQNSYGTSNVTSMHWLEPISESVSLKKAQNIAKGLNGRYDEGVYVEGINTIDGDITIEAKANHLGVLLAATNNLVSTVTSGSLYTHKFQPRTVDAQALCAERPFTYQKHMGDAGSASNLFDLNASNLELSISNGELLTAKIAVLGGSFARVAKATASYSESNPIDWSVSSVTLGGTAMTNIEQLTITQDNALAVKHLIDGTKTPSRIRRTGPRVISIAGTLTFDDQTALTAFLDQTESRFVVSLKGTSNVQSGFPEQLIIDVPTMRYTEMPVVIQGAGENTVSFKAAARYNVGSATAIEYKLSCGKAGF